MSDAGKTPETEPPEPVAPRRARLRWPAALVMLVLAALIGGGVASYLPMVLNLPANDRLGDVQSTVGRLAASFDADTDALTELRDAIGQAKTRLDAIDARVAALESGATGKANQPGGVVTRLDTLESQTTKSADAIAALGARVNGVEAAVPANLPQRLDSFASKGAAADLDLRVAKLEAANTANTLRQAASILALADLTRAAEDARPFALELATLTVTAPDDPAIKILTPYAAKNIPTTQMLAERFPAAARAALNAEREGQTSNFLTRMWNRILELVSVRRVGDLPGNTAEARLARAQVALYANDLAVAVAETGPITGAASEPLAQWLADSRARLAVDRAIIDMKVRITKALAATGAPAKGAPQ